MPSKRAARWAPLLAASLLLTACGGDDQDGQRADLPDWTDGFEAVGGVDAGDFVQRDAGQPYSGTGFAIQIPDGYDKPVRLFREGTDEPCEIRRDATNRDIKCIWDINELDAMYLDFKYDIVVPDNMCAFVRWVAPMYMNYEAREGPDTVSYTIDDNGFITDEVNSRDGIPYCPQNYSLESSSAPNCCYGTYNLLVTNATTGQTEDRGEYPWNDSLAGCFDGAAFMEKDRGCTDDGWPRVKFIHPNWEPTRHRVEYEYTAQFQSKFSVPIANYFDPDEHDDGVPVAFQAEEAILFYEFQCLDDADETIARIRMQVREWNEEVEFDAEGNPDTFGLEPEWEDLPLNDYVDFRDMEELGIQFPEVPGGHKKGCRE